MLPLTSALKSKTNWTSLLIVALPEIYNMVMQDPTLQIPPQVKHWLTLSGSAAVIVFRTLNTQGDVQAPPSK